MRKKTRKPRVITVYQKLWEAGIEFSITDLKYLNGGTYYLDWLRANPRAELEEMEMIYEGKRIKQFLFPAFFEKKIESKIFFHFQRKSEHLKKFPLEGKNSENQEIPKE